MIQRRLWRSRQALTEEGYYSPDGVEIREPANDVTANLVGSLTTTGLHAPALDIDVPSRLIPSSTEGHWHLYMDVEMPWWRYRLLLFVLYKVGIIERGFYKMSVYRGQSFLRYPGVTKQNEVEHHARTGGGITSCR